MTSDHDAQSLLAAYALDALNAPERERVEAHLGTCPSCREEVASFRETTARLGSAAPRTPPARVRRAVLAEVSRTRQLPPAVGLSGDGDGGDRDGADGQAPLAPPATPRTTDPAVRWLALAASVLLLACIATSVAAWGYRQDAREAQALVEQEPAPMASPDAVAQARFSTAGQGTMVVAGQRFLLVATDLPDLPSGTVYKLWFVDEDGPRPSVALTPAGGGRYVAEADGFRPGDDVAVTVETDPDTVVPRGQTVMQAQV
ncbi:anti-sigma factor [Thalassiella azotivora]